MANFIIFQSSVWIIILLINLFLIWKYISISKQVNSFNFKENGSLEGDCNVNVGNFNSDELSRILAEIQSDEILKRNYKIKLLFDIFNTKNPSNLPTNLDKDIKVEKQGVQMNLLEIHPDLTKQEIKLCNLIMQNKTSKEIAKKMGLSYGSMRVYKTKLKTRLNLSVHNSLENYLSEFS